MPGAPILVVDDAPVNLKLMRLLLTHEGYEVRTAERAEDALEMLSDYRPELILTDLQMPGMDGLEMTRRVKRDPRTKTIRVVALTACAMKEDRERALQAGCDDYISKPVNTAALAAKVRELLARPAISHAAPETARETACGPAAPAMEELRRGFFEAGTAESRRLLDSLNSGFDAASASRQLHEWIGSAALLGYTQISSPARQAEDLLRKEPVNTGELRVLLTDLVLMFAELAESLSPPVPDYIAQAAKGKRIALLGLTTERADAMCAILERVQARPRLFDASEDAGSAAIGDCDLVVFHVRPETAQSRWLDPGMPAPPVKRLIYAGEQPDLMALPAAVRSRGIDFLAGRWEPQDVLLRLAFALSRPASRVPEPAPEAAAAVAARENADRCAAPARPPMAVARPNVVLADDDGIVRTLVGSTLLNHGMCCRTAENGREALHFIRTETPHAAVLDVNMPGMTGYEVLAAIRKEKIPSRVILLTSEQQEEDILRGFRLGADDYMTKPFSPFELVARLKRLMQ